jgi:hypothetical protein
MLFFSKGLLRRGQAGLFRQAKAQQASVVRYRCAIQLDHAFQKSLEAYQARVGLIRA